MRFWLIRCLLTLLGGYSPVLYNDIDSDKKDDWLLSLIISPGFQSYFKYRDLQILKTMGNGVSQEDYWRLVGQRTELLYLIGESKRIYEQSKRKSRSSRERNSEDV